MKNILISSVIFIGLLAFGYLMVDLLKSKQVIEKKAIATSLITSEGFAIKSRIDRALSSTYGLGILIKENKGQINDFQQIAVTLKEIFNEIDILIIAPNLYVSDVYPPYQRKWRVGTNLLSNEERKIDILSAIRSKKLSLGGPYTLIDGGKGLIGRLPVFITDNINNEIFWGLITVTINIDHLIDSTNLKSLEANGYYYELNRFDHETKKYISIIKTNHKKMIDPVTIEIDMQNTDDNWYLSLSPKSGWISSSFIYSLYILVLLFSLAISLFIFSLLSQPKILKEKIRIVTEELNNKNKLLNQSEKLANFAKLTSAIAHEIRQPLNSIKILTDGVLFWDQEKHKTSKKEFLSYFSNISNNVDKIDEIIKNLKLMINSPDRIETNSININNIIKELLKFFNQKASNHSIIISLELDNNIKEIMYSERQFQQIIINLVDNAINSLDKTEKNDKMIKIKTSEEDTLIKISIIDNGVGIANEIKDRIFEPFFTTGTDKESMGMGLYVVKNIIKNFNSEIYVKNNEFNGATFEIILKR